MLIIKNLHAEVEDKQILKGIDLTVNAGEVHAIMGPNGSGKSSLAAVLAGRENYHVTEGEVSYEGKNLLEMAPEVRAREGVFLAFQYPIEIPGVSNINFLKTALAEIRTYKGLAAAGCEGVPAVVAGKAEAGGIRCEAGEPVAE